MRVLAYELRRLRGLRSTWLLLVGVLLCDAVVAAVLAAQAPAGVLSGPAGVRLLTATVPLIPLPFAALAAGVLGALSYGHEVRYPGLPASQVSYLRRVRALLAKLAVVAPVAGLLALATLLVDAVAVHLALPAGVTVAAWSEPAALSDRVSQALASAGLTGFADLPGALAPAALGAGHGVPVALLAFVLLTVVAAWTGVLTASLTRSAAAGVLLLCALPPLLESGWRCSSGRPGRPGRRARRSCCRSSPASSGRTDGCTAGTAGLRRAVRCSPTPCCWPRWRRRPWCCCSPRFWSRPVAASSDAPGPPGSATPAGPPPDPCRITSGATRDQPRASGRH